MQIQGSVIDVLSLRWPNVGANGDLEVDIYTYPYGYQNELRPKPLTFGKWEVRRLIETIMKTTEGGLTLQSLSQWRELLIYAVNSMKSMYESPDVTEDYPVRVYYKPAWAEIEAALAAKDDNKLIEALMNLRSMIEWE